MRASSQKTAAQPYLLVKSALRGQLRRARRALTIAEHRQRSYRAAAAILRATSFKCGARVAIYLPFDGETNTAPLLAAAARRGVRLFVPVVVDLRHRRLRFLPLSGKTRRGVYGISVPHRSGRALGPRWFDMIVVPLVGVDRGGRRLGMGGGFYDRALAFRRGRLHWRGPRLIGLCFDCQTADSICADPWDLRLDSVATESGLRRFSEGGR